MSGETRGHAIRTRRLAHGIKSVSAFAKASGVSRDAVTAAEDGTASAQTYDRLEAWLDRFDEETGADMVSPPQTVTITVKPDGEVVIEAHGKIDPAALRELAAGLLQDRARDADDS